MLITIYFLTRPHISTFKINTNVSVTQFHRINCIYSVDNYSQYNLSHRQSIQQNISTTTLLEHTRLVNLFHIFIMYITILSIIYPLDNLSSRVVVLPSRQRTLKADQLFLCLYYVDNYPQYNLFFRQSIQKSSSSTTSLVPFKG